MANSYFRMHSRKFLYMLLLFAQELTTLTLSYLQPVL
nr:MAG TPA: hypothetical protein [Caudoviricetes sp.]